MDRTLNSLLIFINQHQTMEQLSSNQAGFQQLIDQEYKQISHMIEQLEMKSIHSSNSQNSLPENHPKEAQQVNPTNNTVQKDKEIKVQNQFQEEEKNTLDNVNVVKEDKQSNQPLIYDYHCSKDVNLLSDLQSSRQLECVESTKIYPFHKQQELNIISQQKEENRINCANRKNKEQVEKFQQVQQQKTFLNNQQINKKKYTSLMACQRRNNKTTQKYQKEEVHAKVQPIEKTLEEELKYNHEFEQYFSKCKLDFFGKCCKGGHPINMICVEKACNAQAEHCLNEKCNNCIQNHRDCCLKFTYAMFVKSLQGNVSRQKNTMQIVYEAYSNILNEIQKNRQKTMKFLCVQGVNQSLMAKFQQRYQQCNYISFKGKEVLNALEQLNHQSENNTQREIRVREKMKQDEKEIITKLNKEMHLLFEPYSVCSLNILNSHLISNKNDVKFILEQLNYPRDMKLLYRASQHEFSINKFHQICDNQQNTFTIIKTEFGKFIGGFTPLKWNAKYGRDRTNKTFLLAINLKEKLQHINHGQSAIYYDERLGPSFGGLFETKDLQIFAQNGLLCCRTSFPNTFNWKKFFTSSQESWKFLTGVQVGRKCRVMDYQVFKVYFRSQKKQ